MKEKYKVLIVDKEEDISGALKNLPEKVSFKVETVQNTLHAFEKIKSDKFHIVLVDIDTPEMDGLELLKQIKSYDALTQVIMMSRHSTMDKILSSLEHGANDYIQKPFENEEHVMQVIDYSVRKLERWREAIIQLVK